MIKLSGKQKSVVIIALVMIGVVFSTYIYTGQIEPDFDYEERMECYDKGDWYVWNWDINTCMNQDEYDEYLYRTTLTYTTPVFTTTQPITTQPITTQPTTTKPTPLITSYTQEVPEFSFWNTLIPIILGVFAIGIIIKINRKKVI